MEMHGFGDLWKLGVFRSSVLMLCGEPLHPWQPGAQQELSEGPSHWEENTFFPSDLTGIDPVAPLERPRTSSWGDAAGP